MIRVNMLLCIVGAALLGMIIGGLLVGMAAYRVTLRLSGIFRPAWAITLLTMCGLAAPMLAQGIAQRFFDHQINVILGGTFTALRWTLVALGAVEGILRGFKKRRET